ncbi:MAG: TDP-N-acetylfucosamine:lipid II N-acetylfucosaminyltransferase [Saprospiraceae bacterium]
MYYQIILRENSPFENFRKAIPRIRNILWYVEDEIKIITSKIQLPPWIFLQFFTFNNIIPDERVATNRDSRKVLIGNSATIENNHFDVLNVLTKLNPFVQTYSLPMTYGQYKRYKSKVKKVFSAKLNEKVFFLEKHLSLDEYYSFINQHPTAIFLHYRQQGLGNILYLIYNGTKVYLSERNTIYHWLKRNGIMVFNFEEDFISDYNNNNLLIDLYWSNSNREQIKKLLTENQNETSMQLIETDIKGIK